ncbi:hypothetical protein SCWH03_38690 [Streptomyces pacificus]|uniref:Uncharacterized protein n=1 Tax=Streptomyces pacificus TaxID=2705029 RepID=A0A6A0AZ68_9ACTN|nr:hypothetical protein SCWH03_38690 [Streptomyces pacificus]
MLREVGLGWGGTGAGAGADALGWWRGERQGVRAGRERRRAAPAGGGAGCQRQRLTSTFSSTPRASGTRTAAE